jgi:hypothetical protein
MLFGLLYWSREDVSSHSAWTSSYVSVQECLFGVELKDYLASWIQVLPSSIEV